MSGVWQHKGPGSEAFVEFAEEDRPAILALLGRPDKQALWEWQYLHNPAAVQGSPLVLLKIDGSLAGFNGTIPVNLRIDGRTVRAIWSCDTVVAESWRGRGLGQKLFAEVERKAPIVLGKGISDMAYPLLTNKRGWCAVDTVETFFFQRSVRSPRDLVRIARHWRALTAPRGRDRESRVEVLPAEQMPDDIDELWAAVAPEYGRAVVRDYAYMSWKYARHPSKAYTIATIRRDGKLRCIGVLRANARGALLVDYVGPLHNPPLTRELLRAFARAAGAAPSLIVVTSDPGLKARLIEAGYLRSQSKERFAIWTKDPIENIQDGWFIMRGDSDGDLIAASSG